MTRLAALAFVLATALGAGCATTTKIVSEPPGAQVFEAGDKDAKDGKAIGKTPMSYEFKGWLWESKQFKVSAPGYRPKNVEIKRNELDLMPTIGALCLFPFCCPASIGIFLAGGMKMPEE